MNHLAIALFVVLAMGSGQIIAQLQNNGTLRLNRDVNSNSNKDINQLRRSLTGEPGIDYPIFRYPPVTTFSCVNRLAGYYADVEARCQVFRVCTNTDLTTTGFAFLCPNGTLFNQKVFVCDWYTNVDCSESENYYLMNKEMGMKLDTFGDIMSMAKKMISFPMNPNANITQEMRPIAKPISPINQQTSRPFTNTFPSTSPPLIRSQLPIIATTTTRKPQTNFDTSTRGTANKNEISGRNRNPGFNTPNRFVGSSNDRNNQNGRIAGNEPVANDKPLNSGPIFVSNLGELSTDPESTFDPSRAQILERNNEARSDSDKKSAPNAATKLNLSNANLLEAEKNSNPNPQNIGKLPLVQINVVLTGEAELLSQIINEVQMRAKTAGEIPSHSLISSGEAELVQFIEQILRRKLTQNEIDAIFSGEGDLLSQVINDFMRNSIVSPDAKKLLRKLLALINRIKGSKTGTKATSIDSNDSGDLLPPFLRNSQRNSLQNPQQLEAIFSGEADLLSQIINECCSMFKW